MQQLVHTEEDVKKAIARELHDEIGQNITAIQIQSMLVRKTAPDPQPVRQHKSMNWHRKFISPPASFTGNCVPPVLSEMSLENALRHLITEFAFGETAFSASFIMN